MSSFARPFPLCVASGAPRGAVLAIVLTTLVACAPAPSEPRSGRSRGGERVVTITVAPIQAAPGSDAELRVRLSIRPGFHIQPHTPSKPSYIRTELHLEGSPDFESGAWRFPNAHRFRLGDDDIEVYDGEIDVTARVMIASSARPGDHELAGYVRYQACNDGQCLFPLNEPFVARIRVAAPAEQQGTQSATP